MSIWIRNWRCRMKVWLNGERVDDLDRPFFSPIDAIHKILLISHGHLFFALASSKIIIDIKIPSLISEDREVSLLIFFFFFSCKVDSGSLLSHTHNINLRYTVKIELSSVIFSFLMPKIMLSIYQRIKSRNCILFAILY